MADPQTQKAQPVDENDPRLTYLPFDEATNPPGGAFDHLPARWWIVHPERGLLIWKGFSPQCNHDKRIVESLRDRQYPWAEVRFIPSVFIRHNPA